MSMMQIIVSAKDMASGVLSGISRQLSLLGRTALRLGGLGSGGMFASIAIGAAALSREFVKIAQAARESGDYDLVTEKQSRQVENAITLLKEYKTQAALSLGRGILNLFGRGGGGDEVSQQEMERQRAEIDRQLQARRELHDLQFNELDAKQQMESLDRRIATLPVGTDEERLTVAKLLVERKKLQAEIDKQAADESERAAKAEAERLATLEREAAVAQELAAADLEKRTAANLATAMAVKNAFQGEGGLRGAMRAARDKNREEAKWNRAVGLAGRNLARQGINPNDPSTWRKLSQADRRDLMLAQAGGVINQQGNPEALAAKAVDSLHETVKARLGFVGGA